MTPIFNRRSASRRERQLARYARTLTKLRWQELRAEYDQTDDETRLTAIRAEIAHRRRSLSSATTDPDVAAARSAMFATFAEQGDPRTWPTFSTMTAETRGVALAGYDTWLMERDPDFGRVR